MALDRFREKALGDNAGNMLKMLKKKIQERSAEFKQQNIDTSDKYLRKYINHGVESLTRKMSDDKFTFQDFLR